MRRILGSLAVLLLAALAFAGDMKPQTLNGYLVDVACGTENTEKPKADFGTKHSKQCLQMPECVESGYAVLTADNKIIKFDKDSNEQIKKFIADTNKDRDWKVTVTATLNKDNTLKLGSIKLQ